MSLRELYRQYKDRVEFLVIYIHEARLSEEQSLGKGINKLLVRLFKSNKVVDVYEPKTIEARRTVASRCLAILQYDMKTYVDEMDDAVNEAYAALPSRLYFVGIGGRVVYAGGLGPSGFKTQELETAIRRYFKKYDDRFYKN